MKTFDELKAKYPRLLHRVWFEHREGWVDILDAFFVVVDHVLPTDGTYTVRQIKEKMGTLRIYDRVEGVSGTGAGILADARELAEARSYYACEWCGQPGVLRNREGYYCVTCDEHALYEGRMAVPLDPPADLHIGSKGAWKRYDPDLDAFVKTEAPDWS